MTPTFICKHCKKRKPRNIRIKDQRYCGSPACQRARKTSWERKKNEDGFCLQIPTEKEQGALA